MCEVSDRTGPQNRLAGRPSVPRRCIAICRQVSGGAESSSLMASAGARQLEEEDDVSFWAASWQSS